MSKRKQIDDAYPDTFRSTRSCPELQSLHQSESLHTATANTIYTCLSLINSFKVTQATDFDLRHQSNIISQTIPPLTSVKPLQYTNQLIEIPLATTGHKSLILQYNQGFPYIREPTSVGVNCTEFLANPNKYRMFTKLCLKKAILRADTTTFRVYRDHNNIPRFTIQCLISSENGGTVGVDIDDVVLARSNIVLDDTALWETVYSVITNDETIGESERDRLRALFATNIISLFDEMKEVDVVVRVKNGMLIVHSLLHNYYTL